MRPQAIFKVMCSIDNDVVVVGGAGGGSDSAGYPAEKR